MIKDIRRYTVGIEVLWVRDGVVTIRPYTIIDGDRAVQANMELVPGDGYEVSYTKTVEFKDTIDTGDRKWTLSRLLGKRSKE